MRKFALALLVLFCSCSGSDVPNGILPPEKMQAVLWDFIRADIFANEFVRRDTSKNADIENIRLQQQVFKLHKVTKKEFYDSYDYYLKHQAIMRGMMDTMVNRQQRIVEEKKADTTRTKIK